jgi:hypothetical protein
MRFKKISRKSVCLTARDIEILKYLWRWKCSTFLALNEIFFANSSSTIAYRRISKLRRYGLIDLKVTNHFGKNLFVLSPLGFERILGHIPELKESGFKSENMDHDFLVSVIHQGDWLKGLPPKIQSASEQELRRVQAESLPLWVPKSILHRADGYWYFSHEKGGQAIALEVELSRKERGRYAEIQRYFEDQTQVSDIIWVVQQSSLLHSIQEGLGSGRRLNLEKHSFLLLEDVLINLWEAPVVAGKYKGHSIKSIFNLIRGLGQVQALLQPPEKSVSTGCLKVSTHVLLDDRKSPQNQLVSRTKKNLNLTLTPHKSHTSPSTLASSPSYQAQATSPNQSQSNHPAQPIANGESK